MVWTTQNSVTTSIEVSEYFLDLEAGEISRNLNECRNMFPSFNHDNTASQGKN